MNLYEWLNHRHHEKWAWQLRKRLDSYEEGKCKTYTWAEVKLRSLERDLRWKRSCRQVYVWLFGYYGLFPYRLSPRRIVNEFVWAWQRVKRGWSDRDTWNIDYHATRVLGEMVGYLAEHNHSYPGFAPWETPEKWDAHLRDLSVRLLALRNAEFDVDGEKEAYEVTKQALREFTENYGRYWDLCANRRCVYGVVGLGADQFLRYQLAGDRGMVRLVSAESGERDELVKTYDYAHGEGRLVETSSRMPVSVGARGRRGEDHPNASLSDGQVRMMREYRAGGWTYQELSVLFEICPSRASEICRGLAYKDAGGPIAETQSRPVMPL